MTFLGAFNEVEPTPWTLPSAAEAEIEPTERFNGPGHLGLEVAVATSSRKPFVAELRSVWKAREDTKGFPLLLVVLYDKAGVQVAAVCGPMSPSPVIVHDVDPAVVERLCAAALSKPDRITALSFLTSHEVEQQSELPGIRNVGLFATNELANGVPTRDDWGDACQRGSSLRGKTNQALIVDLGYEIEPAGPHTSLLVTAAGKHAVAVFLDEGDEFETPTQKLELFSPVTHALAAADRLGLDWVVLVRGSTLRLYPARPDVGVGRRGWSGTYFEAAMDLLGDDQIGMVPLFFDSEALQPGGTVEQVLESSSLFVAKLGGRLRDRIYFDAVPGLAATLASKHGDTTPEGLQEAYAQTMAVLFRLLFVAYAEDKELLPYRTNGTYAEHALTTLAKRLSEYRSTGETFDANGTDLWDDAQALWTAIEHGRDDWDIPPYGGTLFSSDPGINPSGAALAGYRLTNEQFGPTLSALLVDVDPDGLVGPVDFRSLSVREFGTIYEGLLESELSLAPYDLTEGAGGLRATEVGDEVHTPEGAPWFHNRSGERKSTGSYFTKPFAVEHLLKTALAPALGGHLKKVLILLAGGDEAGAAKRLFEFRCADIAMGSGHFLVAAIDHLEAAFSKFLVENPIGPVNAELVALRTAAKNQLGHLSDSYQIDDTQILRRLIARRCVFGCDLNPIAVELARLSIWIHTFVAGLPLGFLDHNLRVGNSLTGIGLIDEVDDFLGEDNFLTHQIADQLSEASRQIQRLATVNDARITDIEAARQAVDQAQEALNPMRRLLDLIVLRRAGFIDVEPMSLAETSVVDARHSTEQVQELLAKLQPIHFPVEFPEIFSGSSSGFTCILGNPPWEEATVEELGFWTRHDPGLKAKSKSEQKSAMAQLREERPDLSELLDRERLDAELVRSALTARRSNLKKAEYLFPGMGTGDPDMYKAFCWQFWRLSTHGGTIGVVLPRSVFVTKGSSDWRVEVLQNSGSEIVFTKNKGEWLFTDVNPGWPICLVSISKQAPTAQIVVRGTFESLGEYLQGINQEAPTLPVPDLLRADPLLCIPSLESSEALALFASLITHPVFGAPDRTDWRALPIRELDVTNDAEEFFTDSSEDWPVYNHRNIGHFRFEETEGIFSRAELNPSLKSLQAKRERIWGRKTSPFTEMSRDWAFDPETLPARHPRLALRDVVHSTNTRKIWAALVPQNTILTNAAPYLIFPKGELIDQAYLLGMLNSSVLDWFGHAKINLHLNYFILNSLPIPENPNDERSLRLAGLAAGLALRGQDPDRYDRWVDIALPVEQSEVEQAIAEVDAIASLVYGLPDENIGLIWEPESRPDLDHVREFRNLWS